VGKLQSTQEPVQVRIRALA